MYFPRWHAWQLAPKRPATHTQLDALTELLNLVVLPAAHSSQLTLPTTTAVYIPSGHALQLAARLESLNVPAAQAVQLDTAVPEYVPERHGGQSGWLVWAW